MSWETSSFASYASTLASVPEDPEVLAQDPIRMDKVHRKIKSVCAPKPPLEPCDPPQCLASPCTVF